MTVSNNIQRPRAVVGEEHTEQLLRATIMMVDDEPLMLEVLELYLSEEGYWNFVSVSQSTEAMAVLQREIPDIVFLDLVMPEVDGFDILREIRADEATKHLPVIILTSSNDAATKLKALELGATDFLGKPIDSSELALRLRNTLTVKAYQDQLAFYDGLTGLPNRTLFLDRLKWSITQADRAETGLSVMNVSLDRFRAINDSLGPLAGDEIIKQAASRLASVVREVDVVGRLAEDKFSKGLARMGGDEFSILLPGLVDESLIKLVGDRVLSVMREAFTFEGYDVYSTASIGVTRYPEDGADSDSIIKHASAANEWAKQQGRDNYQFYQQEMSVRANQRLILVADLHRALERGELLLHYQPQVEASTGRVVGVECLVRWLHPERGLILPNEFIPLAEEDGLIIPIGEWVIREACRQAREWQLQGLDKLDVSVNVSARQFRQPRFVGVVADALSSYGFAPRHLVLELTEGAMMEDVDETADLLDEIKKIGVSISVDDFGTGYSSMAYLKRFPIDEIKIDRSFVAELPDDEDDTAIVKALVAMSQLLELRIVAEGVETEAQLEFLRGLNCDVIQGYFFSRPLPAPDFAEFVTENRQRVSIELIKGVAG
ncbi:MAG: EAL domain-containing protein [Gammaproteobacteria bacterium]|nr:EAL domain-containing protein [Gammaproteobacteria bacterium]